MRKVLATVGIRQFFPWFVLLVYLAVPGSMLKAQMARNPILYTDVPDPDVVRVGDTYYMSSTTMQYNPGIPIMKSTDLANWELVNYAYDIMDNNAALNLENGQEAYSGGTWASSINYHEGRYYVSSFSYSTGRTYIYHTADIENGPWTKITINRVFHDHTLFFDDDGRVYMAYGHDNIQLTELKPDLTGVQPGGIDRVIIQKASSVAGSNMILTAEGTRLQKINGTYYVSNICWPSGSGRTQILHKSSSLTGNYEGRVVFQSSQGSAQGEYIDTPDGKWYAMFFHDHGALGRMPDLMPVTWNNGWPTVGVNGQIPATLDIPGDNSLEGIISSDEFNSSAPLKLQWQWNHNPQNNYWSLSERSGYLRLTTDRVDPNVQMTRNTLTQRTYGPKSTGLVELDVSGMKNGDYAGLVAMQYEYGFVAVKMSGGNKSIVMAQGTGWENNHTEIASVPLNQSSVFLRIDFDYTNRVDDAYFYYSLDGDNWQRIGNKLNTTFKLEHFVGYRFGLFSYATQSAGGYADFNFFRVGDDIEDAKKPMLEVTVNAPSKDTVVVTPADVYISAEVSDPNAIETLQFFVDGQQVGSTEWVAPYFTTFSVTEAGTYEVTAVATMADGEKITSEPITITANVPRAPFGGTAHPIPGIIQAEDYDVGGQGFAHNDLDEINEGNAGYRAGDGVDVEETQDSEGDYNVGYIRNGEWLAYTVDIQTTGSYDLDLRMAADGAGKTLHLEMDGADITGPISVPNTTGWQIWETISVQDIALMEGEHDMRIVFDSDYMNLNYIEFKGIVTALESELNAKTQLYPNPFTETGIITTKGAFQYEIYDQKGRQLESGSGEDQVQIGSALPKGLFILKIIQDGKQQLQKLIKQ